MLLCEHPAPDNKKQNRRDERQADEGCHQLRPEPGAEHSMLPFKREFPEAPGDHEDDRCQKQEIRVDQDDDQDIVGKRAFKPPVFDLQDDGKRRQDHKPEKVQQAFWLPIVPLLMQPS